MALPSKKHLYFISDAQMRTMSYVNGAVIKNTQPTPLPQNPAGWKDVTIEFATNEKYFSLNRSFSVPLKLVGDGAEIIRYFMYRGRGYEEDLYLLMFANDPDTGKMILGYKGKIDMSQNEDDPENGVTITTVEGGVLSYLNANDGVTYPLPCDETNPEAIRILFDGIRLRDKYNYRILELSRPAGDSDLFTMPVVFLNNEGDSVGIIRGEATFEPVNDGDFGGYIQTSANYLLKTTSAITVNISGSVSVQVSPDVPFGDFCRIFFVKSSGNQYTVLDTGNQPPGTSTSSDFNIDIPLGAGERLFLFQDSNSGYNNIMETTMSFLFFSRATPSTAWAIRPLTAYKALVSKMSEGKHVGDSQLFAQNRNLVLTTGDSIRNTSRQVIKNYFVKTTFSDFVQSYLGPYGVGIKMANDVIYIERKKDIYSAVGADIFDLGGVSNVKITYAKDKLVNTVRTGSPNQDYDQRNGKYETNTVAERRLPVLSTNKVLDLTSKYRQDGYGISFIQATLTNLDSTDNEGDDDVFMVNVSEINSFAGTGSMVPVEPPLTIGGSIIFDTLADDIAKWFFAGEAFTVSGTGTGNDRVFNTVSASLNGTGQLVVVVSDPVIAQSFAGATFTFPYFLVKRENYASIEGVLDNTVFNIEELTPGAQFFANGDYIRSLLAQQPNDTITFQSKTKNKDLVLIYQDGKKFIESGDVKVNQLDAPLFLPYYVQFTTETPYYFAQILQQLNKGNIKINYKGYDIYLLPIGEMSAKPATNEPQEWKLLLSPKTSLITLGLLSRGATILSDYMKNNVHVSKISPVHFVQYGYVNPPQYHHLDIYQELFENRNAFFAKAEYLQKWQKNDTIHLQFITVGVPSVSIIVIDVNGDIYDTLLCDIIPDSSIQLPYLKQQIDIDLSGFDEGVYSFILASSTYYLGISQWMYIAEDFPRTLLLEYHDTKNNEDAWFNTWKPAIRVEGLMMPWDVDGGTVSYVDENENADSLSGAPYERRDIVFGYGYGIPDWMARRINRISCLNRFSVEGTRYVRDEDSKMDATKRDGYPMHYYTMSMRPALADNGLSIVDSDIPSTERAEVYTFDAPVWGMGEGVINVEIEPE